MRYLIIRIGALGDCLVASIIPRYLKNLGHEVYFLTSEDGLLVLRNNPYIDQLLYHKKDSVPCDKLEDHFKKLKKSYECDVMVDLCESIEEKVIFNPTNPIYNYPKNERFKIGNRNFYDLTMELCGFPDAKGLLPEMYFSDAEEDAFLEHRKDLLGKFVIVWCLSGSALHKSYPYTYEVMMEILNHHKDVVFITVGNKTCQILERALIHKRIIHKSNEWNFRETGLACKYASLVIGPETGVMHLSGCFDTPKICFLTHTTKECFTKYFKNDYSLQAEVSCSPCFRMIYEASQQCPIDEDAYAPFCTALGFPINRIIERIEEVKSDCYSRN